MIFIFTLNKFSTFGRLIPIHVTRFPNFVHLVPTLYRDRFSIFPIIFLPIPVYIRIKTKITRIDAKTIKLQFRQIRVLLYVISKIIILKSWNFHTKCNWEFYFFASLPDAHIPPLLHSNSLYPWNALLNHILFKVLKRKHNNILRQCIFNYLYISI